MAVVGSAKPIRTFASTDAQRMVTYTAIYEVVTDSRMDDPITVAGASGLPQYGDPYYWNGSVRDAWSFADQISVDNRDFKDTLKLWTLTYQYHTAGAIDSAQDTSSSRGDPIDWRWEISGDFAQFTKAAEKDRQGAEILNGADEPFIPPPEKDDSRKILVLKKNTPTISLSKWAEYSDTVNDAAIWGLQRRQVKLNQWRWQVKYWGLSNAYVANEWHFHVSYEKDDAGNVIGWTGYYLNRGRRFVADAFQVDPSLRYQRFEDLHGNPLAEPGLLTALGGKLPVGDPPTYVTAEIEFEKDFTAIGIPDPLPGPFV